MRRKLRASWGTVAWLLVSAVSVSAGSSWPDSGWTAKARSLGWNGAQGYVEQMLHQDESGSPYPVTYFKISNPNAFPVKLEFVISVEHDYEISYLGTRDNGTIRVTAKAGEYVDRIDPLYVLGAKESFRIRVEVLNPSRPMVYPKGNAFDGWAKPLVPTPKKPSPQAAKPKPRRPSPPRAAAGGEAAFWVDVKRRKSDRSETKLRDFRVSPARATVRHTGSQLTLVFEGSGGGEAVRVEVRLEDYDGPRMYDLLDGDGNQNSGKLVIGGDTILSAYSLPGEHSTVEIESDDGCTLRGRLRKLGGWVRRDAHYARDGVFQVSRAGCDAGSAAPGPRHPAPPAPAPARTYAPSPPAAPRAAAPPAVDPFEAALDGVLTPSAGSASPAPAAMPMAGFGARAAPPSISDDALDSMLDDAESFADTTRSDRIAGEEAARVGKIEAIRQKAIADEMARRAEIQRAIAAREAAEERRRQQRAARKKSRKRRRASFGRFMTGLGSALKTIGEANRSSSSGASAPSYSPPSSSRYSGGGSSAPAAPSGGMSQECRDYYEAHASQNVEAMRGHSDALARRCHQEGSGVR
jgi:hypothetical protein